MEIIFAPTEPTADTPQGLHPWSLSLNLEEGMELFAVQFVVIGFDTMAVNLENPGVDPLDSVFRPGFAGGAALYSPFDCLTSPAWTAPAGVARAPRALRYARASRAAWTGTE